MSHINEVAPDPSARDYAGTFPYEWGGNPAQMSIT